jgi:hypothetical protein
VTVRSRDYYFRIKAQEGVTKVVIVAAVVAGLVSLFSALFAWRQAERVKRIETTTQENLAVFGAQTQAAIESFRAEQTRSKDAFEAATEEANPIENSLSRMGALIQTVKEEIAVAVREHRRLIEKEEVIAMRDRIMDTQLLFLDIYSSSGVALPPMAQGAAHDAKNIMQDAAQYMTTTHLPGKYTRCKILARDVD